METTEERKKLSAEKDWYRQMKRIGHGMTGTLGLFETWKLKREGRSDGSIGLPKREEGDRWCSPKLSRESDFYEEFCAKVWGITESYTEELHVEAMNCLDGIRRLKKEIEKLKTVVLQKPTDKELSERRKGEEKLTDGLVRKRRGKELGKKERDHRTKLRGLEQKLEEEEVQFFTVKNRLTEAGTLAALICMRKKSKVNQRVDVYWDAVLRVHPMAMEIPVESRTPGIPEVEREYLERHNRILEDLLTGEEEIIKEAA